MATISSDILARYTADAASEVAGVHGLVPSQLHRHRGVRVDESDGAVRVEIHLSVDWSAPIFELGRDVQQRVREYLRQMADVGVGSVDVIVDEIAPPR